MTEGFISPMKWFAVKLNTLQKISLIKRINWQKTWPSLLLWKSNERSLIGVLPKCKSYLWGFFFFLHIFIFFVMHKTSVVKNGHFIWTCNSCPKHEHVLVWFAHFVFPLCCSHNTCILALQKTETGRPQKMKKVRMHCFYTVESISSL